MHTFDADTSSSDTVDINGLIVNCPVELTMESRSLLEYSSNEKTYEKKNILFISRLNFCKISFR
jgi:hypothetical protein